MTILRICLIILLIISGPGSYCQSNNHTEFCKSITNRWLIESLDLTKNCVGFSAPVSARAFAYFTVGLYECGVEMNSNYISLSGQLSDYKRTTWNTQKEEINWPHVFNYFAYNLAQHLYANMPPNNRTKIGILYDSLHTTYKNRLTKKVILASEKYATGLLTDIKTWAEGDGGHEGYNRNFPKSYVPTQCESCWKQTFPGYLRALQPYWGSNRLMNPSNLNIQDSIICPVYSTDTSSAFYKDALQLTKLNRSENRDIEIIAEYWDDAPGYSGTPTGHLLCLGIQMTHQYKFDLHRTLHFYALLGISFNDAFTICWKIKYKYNLIRPITYIQRQIDPEFNTYIPTPPFPEFPSGHSFQSNAGIEVFKSFFSDTLLIIDSTHIKRRDIIGKPRSYKNFTEMANEISVSRYYGGIHFLNTLELSSKYGRLLGRNTISKLQFTK